MSGKLGKTQFIESRKVLAFILFVVVYVACEDGGLAVDAISEIFINFLYYSADC